MKTTVILVHVIIRNWTENSYQECTSHIAKHGTAFSISGGGELHVILYVCVKLGYISQIAFTSVRHYFPREGTLQ
jgi:hypothetical protein